jgi:hypothetical protein
MVTFTESVVEQAALAWLESIGWTIASGPDIAPEGPNAERESYGQVFLDRRLREALERLNPAFPAEAIEDAFRKLRRSQGADLIQQNRAIHRMLVEGVTVEYRTPDGEIRRAQREEQALHRRAGDQPGDALPPPSAQSPIRKASRGGLPARSANRSRPESRGQLTPIGPVRSGSAGPAPRRPAGTAA